MLDGFSEAEKLLQIGLLAVQRDSCLVQLWQATRATEGTHTIQTKVHKHHVDDPSLPFVPHSGVLKTAAIHVGALWTFRRV